MEDERHWWYQPLQSTTQKERPVDDEEGGRCAEPRELQRREAPVSAVRQRCSIRREKRILKCCFDPSRRSRRCSCRNLPPHAPNLRPFAVASNVRRRRRERRKALLMDATTALRGGDRRRPRSCSRRRALRTARTSYRRAAAIINARQPARRSGGHSGLWQDDARRRRQRRRRPDRGVPRRRRRKRATAR